LGPHCMLQHNSIAIELFSYVTGIACWKALPLQRPFLQTTRRIPGMLHAVIKVP
jgi:hypothetical protein